MTTRKQLLLTAALLAFSLGMAVDLFAVRDPFAANGDRLRPGDSVDHCAPNPVGDKVLFYEGHGGSSLDSFLWLNMHYQGLGISTSRTSTFPSSGFSQYKLVFLSLSSAYYDDLNVFEFFAFLANGGRLVLIGENSGYWPYAHVYNQLLDDLNIDISLNSDNVDPGCGQTTTLNSDQITNALSAFEFAGACSLSLSGNARWLVKGSGGQTIAAVCAPPWAWGRNGGDVVVVGDINAFSNYCTEWFNSQFWSNLYFYPVDQVSTSLSLSGQTFISKSQMNFQVCYTNNSGEILGDDEVVDPVLRVLLFANGKTAGDYSHLLDPLPTLVDGASWCDTFTVTVPNTSKTKKVQAILRAPMRVESSVEIAGMSVGLSADYAAFRIEERDASNEYWLINNDEGHDIDTSDGEGGATTPTMEIGPVDGTFGNEGFWYRHRPNWEGDAVGAYVESPPNAGSDLSIFGVDYSAATLDSATTPFPWVGVYPNEVTGYGNRPDLTNPIYGPIGKVPPLFNSTAGGDHGNHLEFLPQPIEAGEPVWLIYFFASGRQDVLGMDNRHSYYWPWESGAGVVFFDSTFSSPNDFAVPADASKLYGNWIVAFHVYDAAGAFPSRGEDQLPAFKEWSQSVLGGMPR